MVSAPPCHELLVRLGGINPPARPVPPRFTPKYSRIGRNLRLGPILKLPKTEEITKWGHEVATTGRRGLAPAARPHLGPPDLPFRLLKASVAPLRATIRKTFRDAAAESHLGDSGDRLRHPARRGDSSPGGLFIAMIASGEEEVTVERTPEEEEARLRYLEFVQQAAAQAVVLAAAAYAYAKQDAGPLRPGVDHVEGTVKAVVGPIYDRYHAVPLDLLKFLDRN
ncbi:hypothetical protein QYE76_051738 [Lolium multiflorum]|uniref:Uncharacterized protein n=1 Tax=Lolium multiflorum TaxID=4521 RepID=A0AAD8WIF2_LOLMU|nr:hypothetical protein QYE76_051738 [Lolium multiflorum]